LDSDAIWLEKYYKHFHPNNDRHFLGMDATIFEGICG
jgi:hypothetical protein